MHAQVGDVETEAQTGMSVLQVVVAERFPGPGSRLPVKHGVRLWGGFSGMFLSSVSGPLCPLSAACSEASLPAVGSSPTPKLARVFSESPTCLFTPHGLLAETSLPRFLIRNTSCAHSWS